MTAVCNHRLSLPLQLDHADVAIGGLRASLQVRGSPPSPAPPPHSPLPREDEPGVNLGLGSRECHVEPPSEVRVAGARETTQAFAAAPASAGSLGTISEPLQFCSKCKKRLPLDRFMPGRKQCKAHTQSAGLQWRLQIECADEATFHNDFRWWQEKQVYSKGYSFKRHKETPQSCNKHPQQPLLVFCTRLKQALCQHCVKSDEHKPCDATDHVEESSQAPSGLIKAVVRYRCVCCRICIMYP